MIRRVLALVLPHCSHATNSIFLEFQLTELHPDARLQYCSLDELCQALMKTAMRQLQLTMRAYHQVQKFSRTMADLAESDAITLVHLVEALQYCSKLDLM